ncbi:uncharacterized protein C8orf48 homolog [Suncus etruscus]|uniref:uncharacterized protein C8orf48 homolog n=1 Tax=Suncus etruscus TaxID=109475 RepID=UPI0021106D2C|nr:uncharacterized protein C8orf48 homolog [Suncus etruscus]
MDISDTTDLSNETFKSSIDEIQSSCSFTFSSGGRQSWSNNSGSEFETESITRSSEDGDQQSETLDSSNYEKLSRKWINYLKSKDWDSEQYQADAKQQPEVLGASDEELNALQSFCTVKINLMKHKVNAKRKKSSKHKKLHFRLDTDTSEFNLLNSAVPEALLNRTYFKNLSIVKEEATTKQHISSECPDCNRKRAELAQSTFLKQKKTLLESLLLQEKIDENIHTKDFLTRVAEAHQDLPRLSDDPKLIWKRLKEKSQIGYFGLERLETR